MQLNIQNGCLARDFGLVLKILSSNIYFGILSDFENMMFKYSQGNFTFTCKTSIPFQVKCMSKYKFKFQKS